MPRKRQKEQIRCGHFTWLLGVRDNGVYYADGRSNRIDAGRHSLGTRNHKEAVAALQKLDVVRAVALGLALPSALQLEADQLGLDDGRKLYEGHVGRPRVVGGIKVVSSKRYRAVLDKFIRFAREEGITVWNQVNARTLEKYAAYLDGEGYAYATEYLELTTLKQMIKFLIDSGRLPAACQIHLSMAKPQGTTTYCWRREEVQAMLDRCAKSPDLAWLEAILIALACTGLRISELASLRWTDIDWQANLVRLTDESMQPRRRNNRKPRETKSGRSRSFPIHKDLARVLQRLKHASDGFVFHGPLGGRIKPDTVRNILVRDVLTALKKEFPTSEGEAGFADGRLHSFRHYFCSRCATEGVPEQVVMAWLGHMDSKMVRHYFHLHDEEAQRQMKRLDFVGGNAAGDVAGSSVR